MTENNKYTCLVAEDDRDIVELLTLYLQNAGYDVVTAFDGKQALEILKSVHADIGIFDIMMPRMDGFELTQKVREKHNMPIIILSAKDRPGDKIFGLDAGADDYITKPFNPMELVARVNAAIRRFYSLNENTVPEEDEEKIVIGDLMLDMEAMVVRKNGKEVNLTPMEFKIVEMLMKHPGRVFTKVQIFENISGTYFESDANTVMVHVSKIREKIEENPKEPKYLKTVRGLGYRFEKIN